jgi:membrane-associated phospholipid phosphatase
MILRSPLPRMLEHPQTDACGAPRAPRMLALAAVLAVTALVALAVDLPAARFFSHIHHMGPGDLRKSLALFEAFAHGIGVATILISVAVLDPLNRWQVPRLALCSYGAGVVNIAVKLLVGRMRPQEFWPDNFPDHVAATFTGFAPFLFQSASAFARGMQSFPSGHAATAAGLAAGLARLYPRGRYLFAALALFAMLQRIECGAHYPSDTLAGAALGVAMTAACFATTGLAPVGRSLTSYSQPKSLD